MWKLVQLRLVHAFVLHIGHVTRINVFHGPWGRIPRYNWLNPRVVVKLNFTSRNSGNTERIVRPAGPGRA